MGVLVSSADFKNRFAVPKDQYTDLDAFINATEESYLTDLLGADLYADFKAKYIADHLFAANPGYLKILGAFVVDYGSKIYRSDGMVAMLCGFMFFDYMSNVKFNATKHGMTVSEADGATTTTIANLYKYLNDATNSFQSIQMYVQNIKPGLFPPAIAPTDVNYNGQEKDFGISIFN